MKALIDIEQCRIVDILRIDCSDITVLEHNKISRTQCALFHSNDAVDRVNHYLQEYMDVFKNVDIVLIERQPISGLVHIEQLLFSYFREKARLLSPNAMHKFFKIGGFSYDQRKEETVKIAEPFLSKFYLWHTLQRKHDISDAMCLLIYYVSSIRLHTLTQTLKQQHNQHNHNSNNHTEEAAARNDLDKYFSSFLFCRDE